jgi:acyl-CoA reductase-like NAD-dependent aldehyde dehydrogenase
VKYRGMIVHFCLLFIFFLIRKLKVGDPFDENTKMGPVVSKEHKEKIEKYIELARQNGNEVITAGEIDENLKKLNKGYYLMPTVVLNLDDRSKLMTEEIFGPVVCIVSFDTEDEVKIILEMIVEKFDFYRLLNESIIFNMVFVVVYGQKISVELIVLLHEWK